MAERAYFARRIELLIGLKRLRTKRTKVKNAAVEQLPLFPSTHGRTGVITNPYRLNGAAAKFKWPAGSQSEDHWTPMRCQGFLGRPPPIFYLFLMTYMDPASAQGCFAKC
jgi:hypothetical protein